MIAAEANVVSQGVASYLNSFIDLSYFLISKTTYFEFQFNFQVYE